MTTRLLFTDLDGTLLDARTYSPEGSRDALERLQAAGVPVIFCSAKTSAEQAPIRAALHVTQPYIVENGSAVIFPDGRRHLLGLPAEAIHETLAAIQRESGLEFRGFQQMTVEEVAALTGLAPGAAALARTRDYSETIVTPFDPPTLAQFQALCAQRGLKAPSGGKFYTITGENADKGRAVAWLSQWYREQFDDLLTLGIGDSPNDAPMLAAVDQPYLVQRPEGIWREVDVPGVVRIPAIGPAGFTEMVSRVLDA